jgi:hypothetical protein
VTQGTYQADMSPEHINILHGWLQAIYDTLKDQDKDVELRRECVRAMRLFKPLVVEAI